MFEFRPELVDDDDDEADDTQYANEEDEEEYEQQVNRMRKWQNNNELPLLRAMVLWFDFDFTFQV